MPSAVLKALICVSRRALFAARCVGKPRHDDRRQNAQDDEHHKSSTNVNAAAPVRRGRGSDVSSEFHAKRRWEFI